MFKQASCLLLTLTITGCAPVTTESPRFPAASSAVSPTVTTRQKMTPADRYSKGLAALGGKGAPRDLDQAAFWFEQVVDTGDPQWSRMALFELGRIYIGEIDPAHTDRVKAAQYFDGCRALQDSRCATQLRELELYPDVYRYRYSQRFTPQRISFSPIPLQDTFSLYAADQIGRALPYLEYYARHGNPKAQMVMALHLLEQEDEQTFVEGMTWAYLAAQQRVPEGQYLVGNYLLELSDDNETQREAVRWITNASNLGIAEASYDLGMRYLQPPAAEPPQYDQARYYFKRAAQQGSTEAMVLLGDMHYEGLGVVVGSRDRARAFYLAAAEEGNKEAIDRLRTRFGSHGVPSPTSNAAYSAPLTDSTGTTDAVLAPPELFRQLSPTVHAISIFKDEAGEPVMTGMGSGIAISTQMMITNFHVVEDNGAIVSINIPRKEVSSENDLMLWEVVKTDKERDLALLRLVDNGTVGPLPYVEHFSTLDKLSVGQSVWAIGSPQGLDKTLSSGIISAFRDSDELSMGYSKIVNYIQTTASISPGSSGGGLFDAAGNLIGITSFFNQNGESLNFAVTVDDLVAFLRGEQEEKRVSDSPSPRTHNATPRTHNAVRKQH